MGDGIMVRLIDVVFILLFGFISVSQLSDKSTIELPRSKEMPPTNPDSEIIVVVGIRPNGLFLLENEKYAVESIDKLRIYLAAKKSQFDAEEIHMRVRLQSNYDAPIKLTMHAADLCDELGIAKGIDVLRSNRVRS